MTMGGPEAGDLEEETSHTYCDNCLEELIDRSQEEDHPAELFFNRR